MRYCPNCKSKVETHLTAGQVVMMIFLWLLFFPAGIIYCGVHKRKCPKCGCTTIKNRK